MGEKNALNVFSAVEDIAVPILMDVDAIVVIKEAEIAEGRFVFGVDENLQCLSNFLINRFCNFFGGSSESEVIDLTKDKYGLSFIIFALVDSCVVWWT